MIIMLWIGTHPLVAGFSIICIVMVGYLILGTIRSRRRINLLEKDCDPEAFLMQTEKQEAITGKNKRLAELFRIDKAVAWIALGEFSKAKELLESFQKELFSANGNTLIIYYIDLISCYYELGEYELAEQIFETKLPLLSPTITRVKQSVNILVGERYFFQGKYEQSREHFSKILEKKLSPRVNLSIIYRLAQLDEIEGMTEQAKEKYEKVASEGNKLYIAKKSAAALAG